MSLQNLLKIGQLKTHPPDAAEIARLLAATRRNLVDAAVIERARVNNVVGNETIHEFPMSHSEESSSLSKGQFLVYPTEDGKIKIEVRLENETVWLTQKRMAELFQTTTANINIHLKKIFAEGELRADSVIKESLITAADGKNYRTNFYNLDAIISVGYRVKSAVAIRCGHRVADHFVGVNKVVDLGSGCRLEIEHVAEVSTPSLVSIPTHKDSLTVRPRGVVRESVVKDFFTTAVWSQVRDLRQPIAGNAAGILGA